MDKLITLLKYIILDISEPAGYLPFGAAAGAVFLLFRHHFRGNRSVSSKNAEFKKDILLFLIVLYAAVLLKLAFFSREPGSRTDVSLVLFETWGSTIRAHSFFIENILMFIPFGILIPAAFPAFRRIPLCTLAGFSCSLFLEFIQLTTGRGFCQLDDLVTNTAGALLGVLLFRFLRRTAERFV